jgi:HK97 family phage major capsid protein
MPVTIADLRAAAERRRRDAEIRLSETKEAVKRWTASHEAAGTTGVPADFRTGNRLAAEMRAAQDELQQALGAVQGVSDVAADEDRITRLQSVSYPTNVRRPAYDQVHRITGEPHVYRSPAERAQSAPGTDPGPSFMQDLYAAQIKGDPAAMGRLERHGRQFEDEHPGWPQKQRAIGTGAVSGFTPPQYLADIFAEFARAGRPVANLCAPAPLPAVGMTFQVPRITTATATGVQATEGGAIGNQDPDDTLLSVAVCTIAGYVDLSRQALERTVLVEEMIFADLAADYNARLDLQLLTGTGANGQHQGLFGTSGINAITYTDATPTVPELWPKLADMVGKVMSGRFTGPTAIVMAPNAWAWILSAVDTTGRPLVQATQVAQNPAATMADTIDYTRPAGVLFGCPVWLDGNVPNNLGVGTNETRVLAADFRDCILFEDGSAPYQFHYEQVLSSTLQVRLLAYGYSGFAGGRQPKAISLVSGTGLIVPAL